MPANRRVWEHARKASGIGAAVVLVYMAFLSIQDGVTLETDVMMAMLALIIVLLYGVESLTALVETLRE